MPGLVEFATADGDSVLVEVTDRSGPVTRGLSGVDVAQRAQQSFEDAIDRVRPAVQTVVAQLRNFPERPDEVQVEFGIVLNAQAGAFIAAASTTANFTVSLTWRREASAVSP